MQAHNVLIRPLVTEKALSDANAGKYCFAVSRRATKTDIKHALKDAFNVTAVSIMTVSVTGKRKRVGTRRTEVKDAEWKKATVKLAKGQSINFFETGVEEKDKKKDKKKEKKK